MDNSFLVLDGSLTEAKIYLEQYSLFFQAVQNYFNNPRKYEVTRDIGELLESSKEADKLNLQEEEEEETDTDFIEPDPESESDEPIAIQEGEETRSEVSTVGLHSVDVR